MSSGHYIKFYVGDYDRATKDLTAVEDGMYFRLLRHCWSSDRPIRDTNTAYRIAGAFSADERLAVNSVLERFFRKTRDGYINGRAQKERAQFQAFVDRQRENGSKGGRPKTPTEPTAKPQQNPRLNPDETHGLTHGETQTKPDGLHPDPDPDLDPDPTPEPERSGKKAKAELIARAPNADSRDLAAQPGADAPAASASAFQNFQFLTISRSATGTTQGELDWLLAEVAKDAKRLGHKRKPPTSLGALMASTLHSAQLGRDWLANPPAKRMAALFFLDDQTAPASGLRLALKAIAENYSGYVQNLKQCEQYVADGDFTVEV